MQGKAKKPRCFKNVKALPIVSEVNKRSWKTSEISEKVLHNWDSQLSNKNRFNLFYWYLSKLSQNRQLIIIKYVIFTTTRESVIQPIDQGIIKMRGYNENNTTPFFRSSSGCYWSDNRIETKNGCFHSEFCKSSITTVYDSDEHL